MSEIYSIYTSSPSGKDKLWYREVNAVLIGLLIGPRVPMILQNTFSIHFASPIKFWDRNIEILCLKISAID